MVIVEPWRPKGRLIYAGDLRRAQPRKYQCRLAIIFRSGGVVHSGRLSWLILHLRVAQRNGPSSGDKLRPPWGLMPGAAQHDFDVGLPADTANKIRVTSGIFHFASANGQ
jgi:hypothetical protein